MIAREVEAYLKALEPEKRETLEKLRASIRSAVPDADEVISYQIPMFKSGKGKGIVSYAAFKNHCSLFVMSKAVTDAQMQSLKPYKTSKGTIQIPIGKSLPAALVKRMVKARVAENDAAEQERLERRRTRSRK